MGPDRIGGDPREEHPRSNISVQPHEVLDAGPDDRQPYHIRQGERLRTHYRRAYGRALRLREVDPAKAATLLREALRVAASASYWLEGTALFARVHHEIHEMGRYAREHDRANCRLHYDGQGYEQRCPVALSHKRFGFSPGLIVPWFTCSLCGEDVTECPHVRGRQYRVRGGNEGSATGRCRVCCRSECSHDPEFTYLTTMSQVAGGPIEVEEVSLVSRPVQPDARLHGIPVSLSELRGWLGADFVPGTPVDCSRCLDPCGGLDYLPQSSE